MKFRNEIEIKDFIAAVEAAKHNVYLCSIYGDKFVLNSILSRYVAIGELVGNHNNELELFCDSKDDEKLFLKFFKEHPEVLE